MRSCILALICMCYAALPVRAGDADSSTSARAYTLGPGLLCFDLGLLNWTDTLPVYSDSALSRLQTRLTAEQTDCPECMGCAEPATFFPGSYHPLFCGGGKGPAFICTRVTASFCEIITDILGARAYIPAGYGRYRSWEQYILLQAATGDYLRIVRQWDTTVLYDKPYATNALPRPDKEYRVKVALRDVDDLLFYPVAVKGYWMKLKAVRNKRIAGYCWIIWRTDDRLLRWFAWRAD